MRILGSIQEDKMNQRFKCESSNQFEIMREALKMQNGEHDVNLERISSILLPLCFRRKRTRANEEWKSTLQIGHSSWEGTYSEFCVQTGDFNLRQKMILH
jgi:hypothetical protein